MIPLFATLRLRRRRAGGGLGRGLRLWLPLFLVWLLLAPLVLVLLPIAILACLALRVAPLRAGAALWGCLAALRGTRVEIETARNAIHLTIH